MKRIFVHIGAASIITLLILCLVSIKLVICITIGLAVLFIASLCLRYFRENASIPLCLGSALFVSFVFLLCMNFVVAPQLALDDTKADISFYITEEESINADGDYVYVGKAQDISDSSLKNIKIRLKSKAPIPVDYYDVVNASVTFYSISDTPFSSYGYWADDIYLTAVCDDFEPMGDKVSSPMAHILHLRDEIKYAFDLAIGGDEGGLATALVTGDKSGISDIVKSYFRFAGASHIMAISGLHLTIVAGTILLILKKLRAPNIVISPVVLATILFYCALAGFSRSVVRAGIMMGIMVITPLFKNVADTLNSLGIAVFLICLNPFAVTDTGALLSILSTLALILSSDISNNGITMDDKLPKKVILRARNRILAVYLSVFVLVFTLPVLYITYGTLSIASIVSNIIIVPFGGIVILLSIFTFGFYKIGINAITAFVATITKYLLIFVITVVKWISSYSGAVISLGKYFGLIIAGALVIIAVCFIYKNGVLLKKGIAVALAFTIVATGIISLYTRNYSYLYITPNGAVVLDFDDTIVVLGVDDYSDYYSVSSYISSRNETIDLLVANGDDEFSAKLTQTVPTNIVLTNELSDYMLNTGHYADIVLKNEYTVGFRNGNKLEYYYGDCIFNIDNISVVFTNKEYIDADIVVNHKNNKTMDNFGRIELSNGDVLYTICGDSFSARRIN